MVKCFKKTFKQIGRVFLVSVSVSVIIITYSVYMDTSNSLNTGLWLQSVEQQLQNTTEQYFNELYDRYSVLNRDMVEFQYNNNERYSMLERRIENLEERVRELERGSNNLTIQNTQINNGDNHNE